MLRRLRFRVTVNTDNRLMSDTSMLDRVRAARRGVRLGTRRLRVAHAQHRSRARSCRSPSGCASSTA
ncbi:MAG: hypothetical protein WKF58_01915 [Ilumatobacteraceae bacterium]